MILNTSKVTSKFREKTTELFTHTLLIKKKQLKTFKNAIEMLAPKISCLFLIDNF